MMLFPIRLTRRLPLATGVLVVCFSIERCFRFYALPSHSLTRRCGNCLFGMAFVPVELGLLGLAVAAMCLLRIPYFRGRADDWFLAAAGVALTPFLIGAPLFAAAFLSLLAPILKAAWKKEIQAEVCP